MAEPFPLCPNFLRRIGLFINPTFEVFNHTEFCKSCDKYGVCNNTFSLLSPSLNITLPFGKSCGFTLVISSISSFKPNSIIYIKLA